MKKIIDLMSTYKPNDIQNPQKITFLGVDGYDVYNISAPFIDCGKVIIAGRVEKRDSEDSEILFFERDGDATYTLLKDYPSFHLQDPYFTFIRGELILGGTKIFPSSEDETILDYHAVKYRGKDVNSLSEFFEGPLHMKDIRLSELKDGRILCLTRPQGDYGGRGKIGWLIVDDIKDLTKESTAKAPLFDMFDSEEWGGANEIHVLSDRYVGVLGHIARFDSAGNRHYYGMSFVIDLDTMKCEDLKIILLRKELLKGECKRPDLEDVIFSGGLVFKEDQKKVELYVGVGDAEAHKVELPNPFEKYTRDNYLVEFKDIVMKYPNNDEPTLKNINLKIKDGEFIVVVGPSGCGKSTTLKVLSGLEEITSGELYIKDRLVNYLEPKDRDIAMVFQNYALYPHFNVEKNISFGLKNLKISREEIRERVERVCELLQISDQLEKMPKDLSGGQQQRVALARAMVREPLVYIFDEPLSNLDAKLRTQTRDELIDMHRRLEKTFFYVTHDQVEAMTMADRIIVLKDGVIQQFDKPINIFYRPKNLFVAKFLGTPEINTYLLDIDSGVLKLSDEVKLRLDKKALNIIGDRSKVYFGIRPDDIKYSLAEIDGYLKVAVVNREILGNQTIVKCRIEKTDKIINVMIKTKEFSDFLYLQLDLNSAYYFDSESEENLNG